MSVHGGMTKIYSLWCLGEGRADARVVHGTHSSDARMGHDSAMGEKCGLRKINNVGHLGQSRLIHMCFLISYRA